MARESMYAFALIANGPWHARSWLGWAVILEWIDEDIERAESCYRRALALNPLDHTARENVKDFYRRRMGLATELNMRIAGGGPGETARCRSTSIDDEGNVVGDWTLVKDESPLSPRQAKFWVHSRTLQSVWRIPTP